jgi:glutathione peroxidase-family protein
MYIINQEGKIYKSYQGYTEKELLEGDIRALLKK